MPQGRKMHGKGNKISEDSGHRGSRINSLTNMTDWPKGKKRVPYLSAKDKMIKQFTYIAQDQKSITGNFYPVKKLLKLQNDI